MATWRKGGKPIIGQQSVSRQPHVVQVPVQVAKHCLTALFDSNDNIV